MVLQEFDFTTASNKKVLIYYFYNGLRPFIQAQIQKQGCNLNILEKVIKKAINIEAKATC